MLEGLRQEHEKRNAQQGAHRIADQPGHHAVSKRIVAEQKSRGDEDAAETADER
jgi:hypothetical protein